jgi:aspartyl-tRNA(Asn)/glutamyl-tRNA(Gln) amidotransferase subunit C
MSLTREEVEHVARLAHVGLSGAEIDKFRDQLSQLVDFFEILNRVDTSGVPPTSQALPLENVMRADEPRPPLEADQILANAPIRSDGYFRVRKVLE